MDNFVLKHTPENGLLLSNLPTPISQGSIPANHVVIQPEYVTVCASDLFHIRHSRRPYFPGHEWTGRVLSVENKNHKSIIGTYVISPSSIGCGACSYCLDGQENFCPSATWLGDNVGAVSSHLILPFAACTALPKTIAPHLGPLVEVSAIAIEAISHLKTLDKTIILGGGPIGIFLYHFLSRMKVNPLVVEDNIFRVQALTSRFNINAITYKELLLNHDLYSTFTSVLDATGDLTGRGAAQITPSLAAVNSKIVIIGKYKQDPNLSFTQLNQKGATMTWLRGAGSTSLNKALSLWSQETIELAKNLIKKTYPLADVKEAFDDAFKADNGFKVLIDLRHI